MKRFIIFSLLVMACFCAYGQRTSLSTLYAFSQYEISGVNCVGNATVSVIGNQIEICIFDFPSGSFDRISYKKGIITLRVLSEWNGSSDMRTYDCIDDAGNSRLVSFIRHYSPNSIEFIYYDTVVNNIWQPFIKFKEGEQISASQSQRTVIKPIMK